MQSQLSQYYYGDMIFLSIRMRAVESDLSGKHAHVVPEIYN